MLRQGQICRGDSELKTRQCQTFSQPSRWRGAPGYSLQPQQLTSEAAKLHWLPPRRAPAVTDAARGRLMGQKRPTGSHDKNESPGCA